MSVDPLAEQFPAWNPYTYTMNNPVNLTDPTGMAPEGRDEWRNKEGQLVYDVNANNGSGGYTKHATAQDKKFGDMLKNSGSEGKKQFDALTKSDAKIKVDFKDMESSYSPWDTGRFFPEKYNENYELEEGSIELYLPTISNTYNKIKTGELSSDNYDLDSQQLINVNLVRDNNLSIDEYATSIFGHEIDHSNKGNVRGQLDKNFKINVEFGPRRVQGRILEELIKKKQ